VAAATALYWATRVPHQYQYRPGTISGWFAHQLTNYSLRRKSQRPIRVYLDGCFDMMHFGHANALRQAKSLGDELVLGLVGDDEIRRCKGPPVQTEEERYTLVSCIKWVDEVIRGVPYDLNPEFMNELFTKHRIDYILHGDDPCLLPDGTDAYAHAKAMGRFRMVKRTEGVSTTDIVGRMLTCTRGRQGDEELHPLTRSFSTTENGRGTESASTNLSAFLPTSRRLVQFSNSRVPRPDAKIVYIDGAFDVFHPGHVKILEAAKAVGDFLLVGVHTDEAVSARRGPHMPIMNLHERVLSVLACKYADEVVIGAPAVITPDLLKTFNIGLVVRGSVSETGRLGPVEEDRYAEAVSQGIYRVLPSPNDASLTQIVERIVERRTEFEARQKRKGASEAAYYSSAKVYIPEL
jgi:ethanolamine-phosphate cytidylyltransferase